MTKGWCPVHDRIVEARDGACPECGTPLVDLTARRGEKEARLVVEEDAPPPEGESVATPPATETRLWPQIRLPERLFGRDSVSLGVPAIAGILIAAVVASFLVGLAIPRREGGSKPPPGPRALASYSVEKEVTAAGVRLRLDRFSQRGRRIFLRITVPDQPDIGIGRITQVNVAPEVANGLVQEEVSLRVRTTVTGFIADGEVQTKDDVAIVVIRITQLELADVGQGRVALDLSRVWPEDARGPIATDRSLRVPFPRRDLRAAGLVGWPDHLEVLVEERGVPEGWLHSYKYTIQTGGADADGEQQTQRSVDSTTMTVVSFQACQNPAFSCVPRGLPRAVLVVQGSSLTIGGRWAWEFA